MMSAMPARRRTWVVLGLVLSFVLPFVLGQLAYDRGWFAGARTNKGALLTPPVALRDLVASDAGLEKRWWLLYIEPAACDAACRQSREALPRRQAGLGADSERVGLLVLTGQGTRGAWPAAAQQRPLADAVTLSQRLGRAAEGGWYLVDPMGWIMLAYQPPESFDAALQRAQDVLDDLHKLLKVSRIG